MKLARLDFNGKHLLKKMIMAPWYLVTNVSVKEIILLLHSLLCFPCSPQFRFHIKKGIFEHIFFLFLCTLLGGCGEPCNGISISYYTEVRFGRAQGNNSRRPIIFWCSLEAPPSFWRPWCFFELGESSTNGLCPILYKYRVRGNSFILCSRISNSLASILVSCGSIDLLSLSWENTSSHDLIIIFLKFLLIA